MSGGATFDLGDRVRVTLDGECPGVRFWPAANTEPIAHTEWTSDLTGTVVGAPPPWDSDHPYRVRLDGWRRPWMFSAAELERLAAKGRRERGEAGDG